MLTGTPELAADWVEYCNGAGHNPDGQNAGAANGRQEPRKVTWWEMDNEAYRKFSPEQYARKVVEFSTAMRAVDPNIKLIIVGYGPMFRELPQVLEICGQAVDAVSDRNLDEGAIQHNIKGRYRDYQNPHRQAVVGLCRITAVGSKLPKMAPGRARHAEKKSKRRTSGTRASPTLVFRTVHRPQCTKDTGNTPSGTTSRTSTIWSTQWA